MMPILAIRRQPAADLLGRALIKLRLVAATWPVSALAHCAAKSDILRGPRSALADICLEEGRMPNETKIQAPP